MHPLHRRTAPVQTRPVPDMPVHLPRTAAASNSHNSIRADRLLVLAISSADSPITQLSSRMYLAIVHPGRVDVQSAMTDLQALAANQRDCKPTRLETGFAC